MNRYQYLRLVSVSGAFLVGFWLPIRLIGFTPPVVWEVIFDLLISLVSVINIILYFHDHDQSPKKIRSWLRVDLFLDFICLLPLSLFAFVFFDSALQGILLFNLLTARHIRHIGRFLDGFPSIQPVIYRLVPLVITLPLLVHLIACAWIALGSGTAGIEDDKVLMYVKAIYWAFTTLTTVGYGDIAAKTIPQMLFTCATQVVGVGVFGYILSNVAGLLARSDAAREHHMDNLDKIETFMNLHRIPDELRLKIRTYYHYMWTNKKGYQDDTLLEGLPAKIQSELFFHINKSIIEKVPFLRGADRELLGDLMSELKPKVFVPGEKIFKVDEHGDTLYFIQHGSVDVVGRDGQMIATLGEGAFFGEMALISDRPRTATVKAGSFCDVYVLHREAFDRVTGAYPEFRHHIEEVMKERSSA